MIVIFTVAIHTAIPQNSKQCPPENGFVLIAEEKEEEPPKGETAQIGKIIDQTAW